MATITQTPKVVYTVEFDNKELALVTFLLGRIRNAKGDLSTLSDDLYGTLIDTHNSTHVHLDEYDDVQVNMKSASFR